MRGKVGGKVATKKSAQACAPCGVEHPGRRAPAIGQPRQGPGCGQAAGVGERHPGFQRHPFVINGASQLLHKVFGAGACMRGRALAWRPCPTRSWSSSKRSSNSRTARHKRIRRLRAGRAQVPPAGRRLEGRRPVPRRVPVPDAPTARPRLSRRRPRFHPGSGPRCRRRRIPTGSSEWRDGSGNLRAISLQGVQGRFRPCPCPTVAHIWQRPR